MQVHELIRILMEMPQDARVILNLQYNEMANGCECNCVCRETVTRWQSQADKNGRFEEYNEYIHDPGFLVDFTPPESVVDLSSGGSGGTCPGLVKQATD